MLPDSSAHSVFADEMPKDLINSNVLDNLSPEPEGEDKPQEACGVFGVLAAEGDVAKLIYFGLYALQHRGQESAGITVYDDRGTTNTHKAMGLVSQVFNETVLSQLKGALAIGHNRYSTTGSSKVCNAQPIVINTRLGDFSLAHNGNLVNATELRAELSAQGHALESTTDSEGIAFAVGEAVEDGKDWQAAIVVALRRCYGAFSLVMAMPNAIAGVRDAYGVRPLVIGKTPDGSYVLSSETCGLDIIGAEYVREVQPGELVIITMANGIQSVQWEESKPKLCVFEMIYFARPDSVMHEESLYSYRMRIGRELAKENFVEADIVIGVPDSGIPAAIGFSRESGGTTSRKIVRALREAGATEVHMRISSPPVTHPCFYGIDTDSQDHLIASHNSVEAIAKQIEVDTLAYLSHDAMLTATQIDTTHFCTACFTGKYPIDVPDKLKRTKLMLENTAP